MNNEINKEDNNHTEYKRSNQNIASVFLITVIILGVFIIIIDVVSGGGGWLIAGALFVGLPLLLIIGASAKAINTSVDYVKNKEQFTLADRKTKKKWLIFNIFFFLFLPVVVFVGLFIKPSLFYEIGVFLIPVILLMVGFEMIVKNKNNSRLLNKLSGWFFVTLGLMPLIVFLFDKISL